MGDETFDRCPHCLLLGCSCTQKNHMVRVDPAAVFESERNGQFDPCERKQANTACAEAPVPGDEIYADALHAVAVDGGNKSRLEKWHRLCGGDVRLAAKLSGVKLSSAEDFFREKVSSVRLGLAGDAPTCPPASRERTLRRAKGNLFGCRCSKGKCGTPDCPCFKDKIECDPNWCTSCGVCSSDGCGNDAIRMKRHLNAAVAPSKAGPSDNRGLFLLENAKKGQVVTEYVGEVLTDEEMAGRDKNYEEKGLLVSPRYVIDATAFGNLSRFVNHSLSPNVEPRAFLVDGIYRLALVAKRDIGKGTELFYDYGPEFRNFPWYNTKESVGLDGSDASPRRDSYPREDHEIETDQLPIDTNHMSQQKRTLRARKKTDDQIEREKRNAAVDNLREEKDIAVEEAAEKKKAEERAAAKAAAESEQEPEVDRELSEYEQFREERVARNQKRLKSLGLA